MTRGLRVPPDTSVGIDRLVAKILCEKHNSVLSPLDSEIKKLGDACLAFLRKPHTSAVRVEGLLIERWLLKLAVGSMASGWLHGAKVNPPLGVVEALFGLRDIPQSVGLFGLGGTGEEIREREAVSFDFFFGRAVGSSGFLSRIHGLPLLLSVCLDDPQGETNALGELGGLVVSEAQLRRHPQELVMTDGTGATMSIYLDWP
jgi:hypothetical protein